MPSSTTLAKGTASPVASSVSTPLMVWAGSERVRRMRLKPKAKRRFMLYVGEMELIEGIEVMELIDFLSYQWIILNTISFSSSPSVTVPALRIPLERRSASLR